MSGSDFTIVGLLIIGAVSLLLFMLSMQTRAARRQPHDESAADKNGRGLGERVDDLVGQLQDTDDPDLVMEATRHLLSMGPGVIPMLLDKLASLEADPEGLSPLGQVRLEEILIDYGLQTYPHVRGLLRSVHRASPAFPALFRVLLGIGPNLVVEFARGPTPDLFSVTAPLMFRFGSGGLDALTEIIEQRGGRISEEFLKASLPLLASHPEGIKALYAAADRSGRLLLIDVLGRWPLSGADDVLDEALTESDGEIVAAALRERVLSLLADRASDEQLLALLERISGEESAVRDVIRRAAALLPAEESLAMADAAGCDSEAIDIWREQLEERNSSGPRGVAERALELAGSSEEETRRVAVHLLGASLDDPRASERLMTLAEDFRSDLGGLALLLLARADVGPLEEILVTRIRRAATGEEELFYLRAAVLVNPEPFRSRLLRLLRSDSPRIAATAAELLARTAPDTGRVLKALGRHRYSPMEALIAPLIWSRWDEISDQMRPCLEAADREVREAALGLLCGLGDEGHIAALLEVAADDEDELTELRLNAAELTGSVADISSGEFEVEGSEFSNHPGLARRAELLRHLNTERDDPPCPL